VVFQARDLRKSFGGTEALSGVSIVVHEREIVGLVGENGAGKSTLLKIVSGLHRPDSGDLVLRGRSVRIPSPRAAVDLGVILVSQEGSLLPNLSIAENIYLGRERRFTRLGRIDWQRLNAKAAEQLVRVGVHVNPKLELRRLAVGQRTLVEIARALALQDDAKGRCLIILDEPTSAMTGDDRDRLFRILDELREDTSIIFVSHHLDEVVGATDRIYVLRDGRVTDELASSATSVPDIQRRMIGHDVNTEYYLEHLQGQPREKIVDLDGLTVRGAFADVSFSVHAGEVVGLCGAEASGCEDVLRALAGLQHPARGTVRVQGENWACSSPALAKRRGIGYVSPDRRREGLIQQLTVADNIVLANMRPVSSAGLLRRDRKNSLATHWIDLLRIRCGGASAQAGSLSGGNQQKVVLAKWLASDIKVLLLDHPTRGIDVGAKEEIYALIRQLSESGIAVVLVADTLEECIGLSHRIVCMRDGVVSAVMSAPAGAKPTPHKLIQHIM
jgi:ribose transport system ATP-binding protein